MTIDQPAASPGSTGDDPSAGLANPRVPEDARPTAQATGDPSPGAGSDSGWEIRPSGATSGVPASGGAAGSMRPWRWWVAILATVLVIAGGAGAALVTTRASTSATLASVPADALVYAEGRLDVPGDQGAALAAFLTHFPGFADTSNLQSKLNQTWDRLLGQIPGNTYTYTRDVAPWIQGTVAIAVLPGGTAAAPRIVALAAVADETAAQAELDKIVADARRTGMAPTESSVGDATVWTFTEPTPGAGSGTAGTGAHAPGALHVALLSGMLVAATDSSAIGEVQDVRAGRAPGLASSQAYRDVTAGAAASDLASVYVALGSLERAVTGLLPGATGAAVPSAAAQAPVASATALASPLAACATGPVPAAAYGTLRAESDRLVLDVRAPLPAGSLPGTPRASSLVDHVPADVLAYVETHDLGTALGCMARQVRAALPAEAGSSGVARQLEGLLGSELPSFVSWLGDAGLVVEVPTAGQAEPSIGLIATVTDEAAATQRLGQLRTLAGFATMAGVKGLSVSDARHGTATITTLTVDPSALSIPGASPRAGLVGPGTTTVGPVSISWTLSDGRFVLGLGPGVVERFLDLPLDQSLGATPAFSQALAVAGGPRSTGFTYLDLRAIRAAAETLVPSAERSSYDSNVRPYLLPFDRLVAVGGLDGSTATVRAVVTVSNPQ